MNQDLRNNSLYFERWIQWWMKFYLAVDFEQSSTKKNMFLCWVWNIWRIHALFYTHTSQTKHYIVSFFCIENYTTCSQIFNGKIGGALKESPQQWNAIYAYCVENIQFMLQFHIIIKKIILKKQETCYDSFFLIFKPLSFGRKILYP